MLLHFFTALITNANTEDNNIDAQWMKCLNQNLTLNEINIPGTHDSGTYFIGRVFSIKLVDFTVQGITVFSNGYELTYS